MTDDVKVRCDGERWEEESWFLGVYSSGKSVFHSGEPSGRITSGEMARAIAEAFITAHHRVRNAVIEECAVAIQTQERGTRYQWMPDSHFGTMTQEMADRLRLIKSSENAQADPRQKEGHE